MLMIEQKLPIKKMALYGSLAVLVGFTGTYAVLNELVPNDNPNLAGNSLNDRQRARANVSNQIPQKSDDKSSAASANAMVKENGLVIRNGSVPSSQTLRTSPTPTSQPSMVVQSTQPSSTSTPMNVVQPAPITSTGGSTVVTGSTPTQSTQPATTATPIQDTLQSTVNTIDNMTGTTILP